MSGASDENLRQNRRQDESAPSWVTIAGVYWEEAFAPPRVPDLRHRLNGGRHRFGASAGWPQTTARLAVATIPVRGWATSTGGSARRLDVGQLQNEGLAGMAGGGLPRLRARRVGRTAGMPRPTFLWSPSPGSASGVVSGLRPRKPTATRIGSGYSPVALDGSWAMWVNVLLIAVRRSRREEVHERCQQ